MSQTPTDLSRFISTVDTGGNIPLARFGHTMTAISRTKVILFGGATGDTGRFAITSDTYSLDLANHTWTKFDNLQGTPPTPRAAHAASVVDSLQMVVYGGATGGGSLASDDMFMLDTRSGGAAASWMIVPVLGSTPGRRYGHTLVFAKPHLVVFGGNTGSETLNDTWSLNVERSPFSWNKIEVTGNLPGSRVYHSACLCMTGSASGMMVIFGGRAADSEALNDTWGLRRHRNGSWDWVQAPYKLNSVIPVGRYQHSSLFIGSSMVVIGGRTNQVDEKVPVDVYDTENSDWTIVSSVERFRHASWAIDNIIWIHGGFEQKTPNIPKATVLKIQRLPLSGHEEAKLQPEISLDKRKRPLPQVPPRTNNKTPEIRLASNVHAKMSEMEDSRNIRDIPVDLLPKEGIRLGKKMLPPAAQKKVEPECISTHFLDQLFHPHKWQDLTTAEFIFQPDMIMKLLNKCVNIFKEEPSLLRLRAPFKIYGNLNGQYIDLLRHFDSWGEPSEVPRLGDIESFDYLFLGDYVDRGSRSLETILLLLALKLKYPTQVYMLRGHHEDATVNFFYGLADECTQKLGEEIDNPNSVYATLNHLFEYMPLAAVIDDQIFAVHGGIGYSVLNLEQIEAVPKPVKINSQNQLVIDLLWSDLCEDERETGVFPNSTRETGEYSSVFKVGADRIRNFLMANGLGLMVRSHECVIEGHDQFGQSEVMTIFSATDYCGKYKNVGAFVIVKRTLEVVTKQIYPTDDVPDAWVDIEESQRPVTPPRWKTTPN